MMQGQRDLQTVTRMIMSELTPTVAAQHGAFFLSESGNGDNSPMLKLIATYGYKARKNVSNRFKLGEALVGQAALEKKTILITEAPADYIRVTSGLGDAAPVNLVVLPVVFEDQVLGVIELASFRPFSEVNQTFLEQLMETIGVLLNTIIANMLTEELLEQSQRLTRELQSQSEELQTQQEELQQTNEELQEKAALLAEQNRNIEIKNAEIEMARLGLEEQAEQLALSSKYKSEFLANMSHELRTPLNSLLILAKLLSENPEGTLTARQVEFASSIRDAGYDLLALISDILDLSKVEAGKMDIAIRPVRLSALCRDLEQRFLPIANQQELNFSVLVDTWLPDTIYTDGGRLQQVLKNLLSNAVKFTQEGDVGLTIRRAEKGRRFQNTTLEAAAEVIAFAVADTGIGIAKDTQRLMLETLQQADGTTNRKYGGTGLGLSISREIARLLGGEIRVESTEHQGSTFTLFLPGRYTPRRDTSNRDPSEIREFEPMGRDYGTSRHNPAGREYGAASSRSSPAPSSSAPVRGPLRRDQRRKLPGDALQYRPERRAVPQTVIADDRDHVEEGDRTVLVIENDQNFAKVLLDMARDKGYKGVVELDGEAGLKAAREVRPDAITLDIDMPGMDGLQVVDRLKRDPETRHVLVHIISGVEQRRAGLKAGAIA